MFKLIKSMLPSILLLLSVLITPMYNGVWTFRADELFGDGRAYMFQIGDREFGYIDAWGQWIIYGKTEDCRIVQVAGDRIGGVVGGSVPCFMRFMENGKFKGWIDFRGHTRPFCGVPGTDTERIPHTCFSN